MVTFSINMKDMDTYIVNVWSCIKAHEGYFKKFNGPHYLLAEDLALATAIANRKAEYEDLTPYVKKLAKTILKSDLRKQRKEVACSLIDSDEEDLGTVDKSLNKSFMLSLQTSDSVLEFSERESIKTIIEDLYLESKDDILTMREVFFDPNMTERRAKDFCPKSSHVKDVLHGLLNRTDGVLLFDIFREFYHELDIEKSKGIRSTAVKEIIAKPVDINAFSALPDIKTIRLRDGRCVGIDKIHMCMEDNVNLDFGKWSVLTGSKYSVLAIDISEIISWVYDMICVEKGVTTHLMEWRKNRWCMTTVGGTKILNKGQDDCICECYKEIVSSFILGGISNIIAISTDYVYIQPIRRTFSSIRFRCATVNKIFDLPVSIRETLD